MNRASNLWVQQGGKRRHRSHDDYTVALLFPMAVELAPLRAMLDSVHDDLPSRRDQNAYILGELGHHNVVVASLPQIGNNDSGVVANQLRNDFPSIRFGLLVGIGGGVPGMDGKNDIRLGDVVVSEPTGTHGGVLQFDRGKQYEREEFELTGHLDKPPPILLATLQKLKAEHAQRGNKTLHFVDDMLRRNPNMTRMYSFPGADQDYLFQTNYSHHAGDNCDNCDKTQTISRSPRISKCVEVHYGTIGSSNSVLKNAHERDRLQDRHGILSVEMEAAGIMNTLPCLVIRGICDYADTHKNKKWQPYAAATAAAFAKELLLGIPSKSDAIQRRVLASPALGSPSGQPEQLPEPRVDETKISSVPDVLVESLSFDRMDARARNITEALPKTCRWIFKHQKFRNWLDHAKVRDHQGFFWIKGNPGCGKSTIMKGILNWAKRRRGEVVVHYFFNARASSDLEKSSLGLYRLITHQLLMACPYLQSRFVELFASKYRISSLVEEWTAAELKGFLIQVAQRLKHQPVIILIDALDEGDIADIADMISFLDDLASNALHSGSDFKICLSSRYFPHITIRKGISLNMEDEAGHELDVETYVHSKLILDTSEEMQKMHSMVCEKSNGIFLWIVLVVPMLNDAYNRGRTDEMIQCLEDVPADLEGLFQQLLVKSESNLDECNLLFTWVLYAQKPLTAIELYVGIQVGSSKELPRRLPSIAAIKRYILDTSRGLVEITKTEPQLVQFIHETVRYFLPRQLAITYGERDGAVLQAKCHDTLRTICETYCRQYHEDLVEVRKIVILADSHGPALGAETEAESYPLLDYASSCLFTHIEAAESGGVPQINMLRNTAERIYRPWIVARNIFQKFRVRRYTLRAPLMYIAADQGLLAIIRALTCEGQRDWVTNERYGTALQAASAHGHEEIVRLLVSSGVSHVNMEGGVYKYALFAALNYRREDVAQYLIQNGARPPLEHLERAFNTYIVRNYATGVLLLIKLGIDVSTYRNSRNESALYIAAAKNKFDLLTKLLSLDYHKALREDMESLKIAFRKGHVASFLILHAHFSGANSNSIDCREMVYTILFQPETASLSEEPFVKMLGAIVENHFRTELGTTKDIALLGSPSILEPGFRSMIGRYINSVANHFQSSDGVFAAALTPLHAAAYHGYVTIVEILLENGTDANEYGGTYRYAIIAACFHGHLDVIKTLLRYGANVTPQQDSPWGTPLHVASMRGWTEIIRVLAEAGADLRALSNRNTTPLEVATMCEQPEAEKLLIELGAQRASK